MIIFTDGGANIRAEDTIPEAIALRISGSYIMDMGVGRDINMMELNAMASQPISRNVITVESFSQMDTMIQDIIDMICDGKVKTDVGKSCKWCSHVGKSSFAFLMYFGANFINDKQGHVRVFVVILHPWWSEADIYVFA